jgi:hypothetical protein
MVKRRDFKVRLTEGMYEEFFRLFPRRGERQAFLEKMVELAISKGRKWSLVQQVIEEVEDRYGRA